MVVQARTMNKQSQGQTVAPTITLNNNISMPQLGLGVWQAEEGEEAEQAVLAALETGYRLIDTASAYGNETSIGRAIRQSGIPRADIFITTKLWNADQGSETTMRAFEASLRKLGMDYVDLYLIHWPVPAKHQYVESWKGLETLLKDGRARAIGVCNFTPEFLDDLLQHSDIVPAVNQIELHPLLQQTATREYCQQHGIRIESWSPIMQGGDLLDDPILQEIAEQYNKSVAQIIIRWHLQHGFIVIPKSVHADRIQENFDVFDFELSDKDMQIIDRMDAGKRTGPDPRTANFA